MNSLRKIPNSTKIFIVTSLLVGTLTVYPFLTENVQSQNLESKIAAVSAETAPEVEWDKTFGGSDSDCVYSVQQTFDGGYIVTGFTFSFGAGGFDFWLIKTDSNGNELWNKTFGGSDSDYAWSVQQTSDKGYIVAGATESFGAGDDDFWLIKTDSNGNKEWDKTFGGSNDDCAFSVQQTSDNGYILAGFTDSFGAGGRDSWLIKTDQNGNKEWDKTFGGSNNDHAHSIQMTSDNGYIIAGYTESFGAGNEDFWLIKTDSNGDKEWDKTFGGPDYDWAHSVQQTSDRGYIVAGYTESFGAGNEDFWLIKTDSNGDKEWDKTFGGPDYDWAHSVQQTSDRGYIVAGETKSFGAGNEDFWLIKLKGNGGTSVEEEKPTEFNLHQNYPNPFNEATTIQYNLTENTKVSLDIYNLSGQKVRTLVDKLQEQGLYNINFNANNLQSGIYFYRLKTQYGIKTEKMMLVK